MIKERAPLDDGDDDFSLFENERKTDSGFPSKEDVEAVSMKAGFPSRESSTSSLKHPIDRGRDAYSRKKHYNSSQDQKVQLNVRTTATIAESFYRISNENEWSLGQTLKRALAALQREINN